MVPFIATWQLGAPVSVGGVSMADSDHASAVPAAPAKVPLPRPRPTVILDKAGKPLPTPPAVASSGDLH